MKKSILKVFTVLAVVMPTSAAISYWVIPDQVEPWPSALVGLSLGVGGMLFANWWVARDERR